MTRSFLRDSIDFARVITIVTIH